MNNCNYLDVDKLHGDCVNTNDCQPSECGSSQHKVGISGAAGGIITWTVKKGINNVIFSGFKADEIQTIKVFIGGIAL